MRNLAARSWTIAFHVLLVGLQPAIAAGAGSRAWSQTGPDGMSYAMSRAFIGDTAAGSKLITLVINKPVGAEELEPTSLLMFARQALTAECSRIGGKPTMEHVEASSRISTNRYTWRGEPRVAWTFVRHCKVAEK